jgi:hypothetical protein
MLQRVQTILLIITVICIGLFLATTSWSKSIGPNEQVLVNPYYLIHTKGGLALAKTPIFYVATMAGLAGLFTIFTIFQYKNRIRQMLFVALNSILLAGAMSAAIYHITRDAVELGGDPNDVGDFGIGIIAIVVALVSNFAANRLIKRDEKLVKSADRMR